MVPGMERRPPRSAGPQRLPAWVVSIGCCGLMWLSAVSAPPARAIPAFARQHRLQCANCHTVVPQLNPFGEQFRDAGYRPPLALEKISPEQREAAYHAGLTPDLRMSERLFGRSPFSLKLTGDLRHRSREDPPTRLFWDELLLNAGGRHQRWSYYLHQHLHKGGRGGEEEYAAWIRANDLIRSPRHSASLQAGLFELAFGLSPHITRVSSLAYLPYDVSIGVPDNFRLGEPELGIQLRGQLPPAWQYAAAVVTGSGLRGENNGAKDLFLRVERAVPNRPAIGLFTYLGRRELRHLEQPYQNRVRRLGLESRWRPPAKEKRPGLHLFGILVWGTDDRVFAADRFRDVRSFAGSLGVDVTPGPKTVLQGRLEWLGTNLPNGEQDRLRLVAGFHRSIQPSLRVTLEGAFTHQRRERDGVELFLAGLWSF
jgi:hypothetical protein